LKLARDANGSVVYKMIGTILVKQDTSIAVSNVEKRVEFIQSELYVIYYFFLIGLTNHFTEEELIPRYLIWKKRYWKNAKKGHNISHYLDLLPSSVLDYL
jgi:hypothetical protein